MANLKKDALEQLRIQVAAAKTAACDNPLWKMGIDELRPLAENHELGTTYTGWKNPYPKEDPRSLLLEYQFRLFHDRSRFKAILQSRQTGKDFTGQGEAIEDCYARPGTEWMTVAPSERQSLDSLDQAKIWAQAWGLYIDDFKVEREDSNPQSLIKSAEILFNNGSRNRAVPGKPDTVRGRSANLAITEFDIFEDPQATWRALLPSITNPLRGGEKKVRIWTTPKGRGGAMHKIWTKPDTPKLSWSRHLVTIYHAVLMGMPVDIGQLRDAMDDAEGFAQECECVFLDGSAVLLPYELIALAESIDATEIIDPSFWFENRRELYCGIDFGRTNDPTICWTSERMGPLLLTREVLRLQNVDTPSQFEILQSRIAAARRTCFDYTGPGIGLGDLVVKKFGTWDPTAHLFGKVELCTFTAKLKRELFPNFRRAFTAPTRLRVPISIEVREDLHAMQQVITNGEYNYWAPRTREGHSDRCTAGALCVRAADAGSGIVEVESFGRTYRKEGGLWV